MANILDLRSQVTQTNSIKLITQAIGDIATAQIKERRKSAELNIKYFQEILGLYKTVKALAAHTKTLQAIQREKNGKEMLVLITSNYKFSGDLDSELVNFYLRNTQGSRADRIVIGASGQEMVAAKLSREFTYIKFAKDYPTVDELEGLVKRIFLYSKILVYHSRFVTLLNQDPTVTDVSASEYEKNQTTVEQLSYILEPEIEKMIAFFEDQMLLILLQAILLESEIARIASRMVSMNQAEEAAEKLFDKQERMLFQARKQRANMKIVESFAALNAASRR